MPKQYRKVWYFWTWTGRALFSTDLLLLYRMMLAYHMMPRRLECLVVEVKPE